MLKSMFLMAFCLLLPAAALAQDASTFHSESFTLENGMEVVVIPNHRAPILTHMVWYKVGAADEPPGLSGMAHYLEHLLFKGTKTLAPGEFSKAVKTLGGNDNAFTSQDYTAYFQSLAAEHLERVMRMEADRMVNLSPPADHYASEKNVVLEERRQRTDNDPAARFSEQLLSALYVNHPYGTPVIGWMKEIERYEWPDIKAFYDRWYAPNNAVLVVSGDITAAALRPLAEKTYGRIPRKEVPQRTRPAVPPAPSPVLLSFAHPDIRQPLLQKILLAPSYAQNPQNSLALQVLAEILDGGPTTRFYKSLVVDKKLASSVSFSYAPDSLDYGAVYMEAALNPGVSFADMEGEIATLLHSVITDGVSAQEVNDAIQRLKDEAVFARDSVTGPAMIFGRALTTGSTVKDVETWPQNIALVSPNAIQHVAKTYLDTAAPWIRPGVTGHLMPEAAEQETAP